MRYSLITAASLAVILSACATTPDPAEVCTADWIKPRSDRAVKEIKRDVSSSLRTITSAAKGMNSSNSLISTYQSARLFNAVKSLGEKFQTSQAVKDLKTLGATCDDPDIIKKGLTSVLDSSGVPQSVIDMFENFQDHAESAAQTEPPSVTP